MLGHVAEIQACLVPQSLWGQGKQRNGHVLRSQTHSQHKDQGQFRHDLPGVAGPKTGQFLYPHFILAL